MPARFLIWSNEHGKWWGPNWSGYTSIIEEAGLYSTAEATKIIAGTDGYGLLHIERESQLPTGGGRKLKVQPEVALSAPSYLTRIWISVEAEG